MFICVAFCETEPQENTDSTEIFKMCLMAEQSQLGMDLWILLTDWATRKTKIRIKRVSRSPKQK